MLGALTPARRRGIEILDAPDVDPALRRRSHRDIALSNALFGGSRALINELARHFDRLPRQATLLDVGTGIGDIPALAAEAAGRRGIQLQIVGVDGDEDLVSSSRHRLSLGVCADARALPFADRSVDVVTCSQLLHHFEELEARQLLAEMHRVARLCVIVSDLRRSWIAVGGLWMASFALGFHPVSRHDGVVSILRGFTRNELLRVIRDSTGAVPSVRHQLGFRITASWRPHGE